jgi:hypothetical protein
MIDLLCSQVGVMRLMATITERSAGVLGGNYLGESWRFGRVLLMAAAAEVRNVGKLRHVRAGIIRMLRQRTVASLAGDMGVLAGSPGFRLIVVAHHAGILPCKRDGVLADQIQSAWPVMAVLAERLGNNGAPYNHENRQTSQQNHSRPNQMGRIVKPTAHDTPFLG